MFKCPVCGKSTFSPVNIGTITVCNSCATSLNFPAWKDMDFASPDELKSWKDYTMQLAMSRAFPDYALAAISDYFDEYINDGFLTFLDGGAGQTIKVFFDYIVVETTSDSARERLSSALSQIIGDDLVEDDDSSSVQSSVFTADNAVKLADGFLSGKLIRTGVGIAASAFATSKEKERATERKARELRQKQTQTAQLITLGTRRIDIADVSYITKDTNSSPVGHLRFVPHGARPEDIHICNYFLFNTSAPFASKKTKEHVDFIYAALTDRISTIKKQNEVAKSFVPSGDVPAPNTSNTSSEKDVIEEIKKFKNLFDDGIISEEEFTAIKKKLLEL